MHEHEVTLYWSSEGQTEHQGRDAVPDRTGALVRDWERHAEAAGVSPRDATRIEKTLGANLTSGR